MNIGSTTFNNIKIGSTTINKVYIGSDKVYPNEVLILDNIPNSACAYSLRKLRTAYTGDAVQVRRTSDNTTQNIGFVNNQLDTTSLNTFCSGTNGFITTWYDQSGNGNDTSQNTSSLQPKIYDSVTGVVLSSGKPALDFKGDFLKAPDSASLSVTDGSGNDYHINIFTVKNATTGTVIAKDDGNPNREFFLGYFANELRFFIKQAGGNTQISKDNKSTNQLIPLITSAFYDGSKSVNGFTMYDNGSLQTLGDSIGSTISGMSNTNANLYIGTYVNGVNTYFGFMSEIIMFMNDQNTNKTTIEDNMNGFYTIY